MISRKILNNPEILAILDRYWEATLALDLVRVHEIYHDDVVVEFPQSGERILGKQNIYQLRYITPLNLLLKSCEFGEKEISGSLNELSPMMDVQSVW
jgi:hypothetical protein